MRIRIIFWICMLICQSYGQVTQIGTIVGCTCTDIVVQGPRHLYVSCKEGVIYDWTPGAIDTVAFVEVQTQGESGLLGITELHGKLYAHYVAPNFDQYVISIYPDVDTLISISALTNFPNHRGGDLDTDGTYLYASVGEGPVNEGFVIRFDTAGNELNRITGLRNPWRIHVDSELWITDVGAIDREEVTVVPIESSVDLNWPCFEGSVQLGPDTCGGLLPTFEYPRVGGTAIIGGYLAPQGYVFADHYDPALYVLSEGTVDTFFGKRYLTVLDAGYAAGWDGKLYEVIFQPDQGVAFIGPEVCEDDTLNPFMDYRLDVEFTNGIDTILIPGHFAADGDAANTSAYCGNIWRVFYNLPEGTWNYCVEFSQGPLVVINGHSQDTLLPHGQTGQVVSSGPAQLQNLGGRYRKWRDGAYFLKLGTDSPETLLAYVDFDNTHNQSGNQNGLLDYTEHIQDWSSGDPVWGDSLGKGIIGAINYLSSQEMNAVSCVVMNINGDGRNVWPFVDHDQRTRYDVSKLEQWRIVLEHAGSKNIHWQARFGEMENNTLLTNNQWKLMFRELISRFGHLPAVTWNLGEEFLFTGFGEQLVARSEYLRHLDPYDHLLVFHNLTVLADIFNNITVREYIDGASLQIGMPEWTDSVVASVYTFPDSNFIICNDEQGPSDYGVPADIDVLPQTQEEIRQRMLYPAFFGGVEGFETYFGYDTDCTDLDCDDFRSREQFWSVMKNFRNVFERIQFWNGMPHQELIDTGYCFGNEDGYLVYSMSPVVHNFGSGYTVEYYDVVENQWFVSVQITDTLDPGIDEWVALVVPVPLGIEIKLFEVRKQNCDAIIKYDISHGILYEWDGMWIPILEVSGQGIWRDETPNVYYRLVAGSESSIQSFMLCPEAYSIDGNVLRANEFVIVYLLDGRELGKLGIGEQLVLPNGGVCILSQGVGRLHIISH